MTVIDDYGRPEPPVWAGEAGTLLGFLDYQRATLEWKTRDVDAAGMSATLAPSTMTLGGVVKHLAWVEDHWFSRWLHGNDAAPVWAGVDWAADENWEWTSAGSDTPDQLRSLWQAAVERSRVLTTEAMTDAGLNRRTVRAWPDGRSPTLRWVIVHMIEEYARHNGHADLLREAVDGLTGE